MISPQVTNTQYRSQYPPPSLFNPTGGVTGKTNRGGEGEGGGLGDDEGGWDLVDDLVVAEPDAVVEPEEAEDVVHEGLAEGVVPRGPEDPAQERLHRVQPRVRVEHLTGGPRGRGSQQDLDG